VLQGISYLGKLPSEDNRESILTNITLGPFNNQDVEFTLKIKILNH